MLAWTRFFEKVDVYVPWAPWVVGPVHRRAAARPRRTGGDR